MNLKAVNTIVERRKFTVILLIFLKKIKREFAEFFRDFLQPYSYSPGVNLLNK